MISTNPEDRPDLFHVCEVAQHMRRLTPQQLASVRAQQEHITDAVDALAHLDIIGQMDPPALAELIVDELHDDAPSDVRNPNTYAQEAQSEQQTASRTQEKLMHLRNTGDQGDRESQRTPETKIATTSLWGNDEDTTEARSAQERARAIVYMDELLDKLTLFGYCNLALHSMDGSLPRLLRTHFSSEVPVPPCMARNQVSAACNVPITSQGGL
jgi:hypothetical protein